MEKIAHKHGLKIQISGIDTLPSFSFLHKDNQKMQTFLLVKCLDTIFWLIDNFDHVLLIITNILKYMKNLQIKYSKIYPKINIKN